MRFLVHAHPGVENQLQSTGRVLGGRTYLRVVRRQGTATAQLPLTHTAPNHQQPETQSN